MKYLRELIIKLDENQFEKLLINKFTQTEKQILKAYRDSNKLVDDKSLALELSIKESTLKKLQSKLLNEVIVFFSSEDILDKIEFLSVNNNHRILLHLARKEVKKLEKSKDFEKLSNVCYLVPGKMLNGLLDSFNLAEIYFFRDKFIELNPVDKENEKATIKMISLILKGYQFDVKKDNVVQYKEEIDAIKINDTPELKFWMNKLLGDYYSASGLVDYYYKYTTDNFKLVSENPTLFAAKTILNSKLSYTYCLVEENNFEDAYNLIKALFEDKTNNIKSGLCYVDLYSQICIVLGKYEEARATILANYPINNEKPGKFAEIYFGNTTILALIDILEDKLDEAFIKISVAKIGLKKQYFIYLDCLLRLVEQAYFYKIKNYELAENLHKKNLKFYQYHKITDLDIIENGHKLICQFYKMDFSGRAITPKYQKYQNELNHGEFAFIGHFIERLNPHFKIQK